MGRSPAEISLLDMIEAVDGPLSASLPAKGDFPEKSADRLQEALHEIAGVIRRQLAAIKLSDLIAYPTLPAEVRLTTDQPQVVHRLFEPHPAETVVAVAMSETIHS